MLVQEFIDGVSRRLRDVDKKQWDNEFLTSALNASLGALTTVMPEAYTVNRDLTLKEGVEQVIDDDLHRIVSILHNVSNVDGTPRRAVTKADMSVFDAAYPHWRQDPSRSYIRHWMLDEFDENKFYVWPPAGVSRGEEPVVPDVPVDPGPINNGFPANVTVVTSPGPATLTNYFSSRWGLDSSVGPTLDPRDDVVVDFTGYSESDTSVVFLGPLDTATNAAFVVYLHDSYTVNDPSNTNNSMRGIDVRLALEAGTPLIRLMWQYGHGWTVNSMFVASVAELPLLIQVPVTNGYIDPAVGWASDLSAMTHINPGSNPGVWFNLNGVVAQRTAASTYAALSGVPLWGFFIARFTSQFTLHNVPQDTYSLQIGDGAGNTRDYDIGYYSDMYAGSSGAVQVETNNSVFIMVRQATDTVRGRVLFLEASDNIYDRVELPPELAAYRSATEVTQEDVDAYPLLLTAYTAAIAAHDAWSALALAHIIRGTFTQTPFIDATPAPVVPAEPTVPVDPGPVAAADPGNVAPDGYYTTEPIANGPAVTDNRTGQNWNYGNAPDTSDNVGTNWLYVPLAFAPNGVFVDVTFDLELHALPATPIGTPVRVVFLFSDGVALEMLNPTNVGPWDNSGGYYETDIALAVGDVLRINVYSPVQGRGQITSQSLQYVAPTEAVTQPDIDAYQVALAQYNADIAMRQTAVTALANYNADTTTHRATGSLPVKAAHIPALQEFMMYYAYSVDDDLTANSGRAQRHWLAFFQMLNKREDANLLVNEAREMTE